MCLPLSVSKEAREEKQTVRRRKEKKQKKTPYLFSIAGQEVKETNRPTDTH